MAGVYNTSISYISNTCTGMCILWDLTSPSALLSRRVPTADPPNGTTKLLRKF